MWLINTTTFELEEAVDPSEVEYAILSHTWGEGEVSFYDMYHHPFEAREKRGFAKISRTCELARNRGLKYAWVDTCCIDKSSSAELSEAINSMFPWYQNSAVCFAYLEDLESSPDTPRLASCRWFTRGWTLQELIAPTTVEFYDSGWSFRFTKEDMASTLSSITRISVDVLRMTKRLKDIPVAVKMSWAARRQTKRPEDVAYCLLGIFDINMPMLYGEGRKAFQRLQEQIAGQTDDPSLFAWLSPGDDQLYRGFFAKSPSEFEACSGIRPNVRATRPPPEFNITNNGIHFRTYADRIEGFSPDLLWMRLRNDCPSCAVEHEVYVSIVLTGNGYVRVAAGECFVVPEGRELAFGLRSEMSRVRKHVDAEESRTLERYLRHPLKVTCDLVETKLSESTCAPIEHWDPARWLFSGDALADDFVGAYEIKTKPPLQFGVDCLIYKLVGGEVDVEPFGRNVGDDWIWDIVEGRSTEALPKGAYEILWTDVLLTEYKREKQGGTYVPRTRLRFRRRGTVPAGEPCEVVFRVHVEDGEDGLRVVLSDEAVYEDQQTASVSGSTTAGPEIETSGAGDVVAAKVSELTLEPGASEQRTTDGAGEALREPSSAIPYLS